MREAKSVMQILGEAMFGLGDNDWEDSLTAVKAAHKTSQRFKEDVAIMRDLSTVLYWKVPTGREKDILEIVRYDP
jgi:hypothetical protein